MSRITQPKFRSLAKAAYHRLPMRLRAAPVYWRTLLLLNKSQWWDEERIHDYQVQQLRKMLVHCNNHVPYYRELFRKVGFDAAGFRRLEQMAQIPTLNIETVRTRQQDLLATNIPPSRMACFSTGGTLGRPLRLYMLRDSGWRERAFIHALWGRAYYHGRDLRGVLRGSAVTASKHWYFDPDERAFIFSGFHLTANNARDYAEVMKSRQVRFFHSYPSAATDFGKLLQATGCEPPKFDAVLLSSENIYPGQREFAETFYGCRVFAWMGHCENVVLAGACEASDMYHVFPEYGVVEVLDGSTPVTEDGRNGELVGTSLYNAAMPLIRYRTGDWATVGPQRCSCGRNHRLLRSVQGRRDQEKLVGRLGNQMSITAINMHSRLFDNVEHFQFYQNQPGRAELRIVPGPNYTDADSLVILAEMNDKFGETVELRLKFVDAIELTTRGKFRYIIQDIHAA
jgi:phenylacetate-CoA ligase